MSREPDAFLADVIHSHNGTKVYIEQAVPALTRTVNGQVEHARMDLAFDRNGSTTYLDVATGSPFSNPALIAAGLIDTHTSTLFRSSWRPLGMGCLADVIQ